MLTRDGGRCRGIGAAVLGVALLLSGCSGDDGSNEGTVTVDVSDAPSGPDGAGSSTGVGGEGPSSSDEPSDPVPEPSEHPKPERPAAMDDTGEKGAIAAAEYFFELYNYVQATGDVGPFDAFSAGQCAACSNLSEAVEDIYTNGGYMQGGAMSMSEPKVRPTIDGLGWELTFVLEIGALDVVHGRNEVQHYEASRRVGARLGVAHFDDGWKALELKAGQK